MPVAKSASQAKHDIDRHRLPCLVRATQVHVDRSRPDPDQGSGVDHQRHHHVDDRTSRPGGRSPAGTGVGASTPSYLPTSPRCSRTASACSAPSPSTSTPSSPGSTGRVPTSAQPSDDGLRAVRLNDPAAGRYGIGILPKPVDHNRKPAERSSRPVVRRFATMRSPCTPHWRRRGCTRAPYPSVG